MRFNFFSICFLAFISVSFIARADDTLRAQNLSDQEPAFADSLEEFLGDSTEVEDLEYPHDLDFRRSSGKTTPFYLDSAFVNNNDSILIPRDGKLSRGFAPWHKGLDIILHMGDTVCSAWKGIVHFAKRDRGGYGNLIVIDHPNGLTTYYGHLSRILVTAGESIEAGQVIGLGGSTGYSTGPHLHFETRYDAIPFDPQDAITRSGSLFVYDYMYPNARTAFRGGSLSKRYQALVNSKKRFRSRLARKASRSSRLKAKKATSVSNTAKHAKTSKAVVKKKTNTKAPVKAAVTKKKSSKKRTH